MRQAGALVRVYLIRFKFRLKYKGKKKLFLLKLEQGDVYISLRA